MASFTHRYPLNVAGKYYIDMNCTDCDLCRETAPSNITRDDRTGVSYIFRQPQTADEVAAVEDGVVGCPTNALGNDGDLFDWENEPIYDWNSLYADDPTIRFDLNAPLFGAERTQASSSEE
ncbi:MAG: ferredoxin [Nitrospira sp.]|nr:ferredoxin [Nitrospira sp.]